MGSSSVIGELGLANYCPLGVRRRCPQATGGKAGPGERVDTHPVARARDLPPELCRGPFTTAQAAALGVSVHVLAGRRFRQLYRGVHVLADHPDTAALRFDGVRLLVRSAAASHHTAALLRSLPVPGPGPDRAVHITVADPASRVRIAGVYTHRAPFGVDLRQVEGRAVLSAERTLCDLAAEGVGLLDLVIFGDAAVRRGWTRPGDLTARAEEQTGRGCRTARCAAGLVRAKVDSPMETRLRLLIVLAGLPEPAVNMPVNDGPGWVATPDLSYPAGRIAIEYDGEHHRTDRRQWQQDKRRSRLLRDLGWDLLECTADDVLRHPSDVLTWLHERLQRAGHPETPVILSDAWRDWGARSVTWRSNS